MTLAELLAVVRDGTWVEVNAPDKHAVLKAGAPDLSDVLAGVLGRGVLSVSAEKRRNPAPAAKAASVDVIVVAVDALRKL